MEMRTVTVVGASEPSGRRSFVPLLEKGARVRAVVRATSSRRQTRKLSG